jgi:hypothetical protein
MAKTTSYINIRTGIKAYITGNIGWATDDNVHDYSPKDASVVFGDLPAVIIDFSRDRDNTWVPDDQGYLVGIPVIIEIYEEVTAEDTTSGRDASQNIANKLDDLEDLFDTAPSIGGLVKGSTILASKIEGIELEAVNLGVIARWAWLTLLVSVKS